MEDIEEKIFKIANKANSLANIDKLNIPIPDGFEVIKEELMDPNLIFVAQKDNYIEQLLTDGRVEENEDIEQRIEKVISETANSIKDNPLYDDNRFMTYYRTYFNDVIEFNIYIQDILAGSSKDKVFIRQLNAYFLEPIGREFCQLSVASGPYDVKDNKLINSITDYSEDLIIKDLDNLLNSILENLVYKDDIEE